MELPTASLLTDASYAVRLPTLGEIMIGNVWSSEKKIDFYL